MLTLWSVGEEVKLMENKQPTVQGNININMDTTPVFYADVIFWNISAHGVVLNFGQTIMGSNQVKIITRVGMSREHAKNFMAGFSKNMALTEAQGQTGKPVS